MTIAAILARAKAAGMIIAGATRLLWRCLSLPD
jgi:hypothetical protein